MQRKIRTATTKKMTQRNSTANLKKKLGIEGQGPTNTELSNKISCTKTNDRLVTIKPKDKILG